MVAATGYVGCLGVECLPPPDQRAGAYTHTWTDRGDLPYWHISGGIWLFLVD